MGKKIPHPKTQLNILTIFFTNIGNALDKKIPKSTQDPLKYIADTHTDSIFLSPCTEVEVSNIIMKLKTCATGWDEVSATTLQENKESISSCLRQVINLSLAQGIFPKELKIAILIPIFKSGDRNESGNYRPISLLSSFSKIFERIFYS